MKAIQNLIHGRKHRLHLVFCLAVLIMLSLGMYFLYLSGFRFDNLVSAFADCFFFLLCIYTGRWLCARWYLRNQMFHFVLFCVLAIACLSAVKFMLVKFAFSHPYAGFMEVVRNAMPFFIIGTVMGMLLKVISASMQKELQNAHARAEQSISEFSLLQSQLSPHFLFNVLNNLYGISIEEHQRIPVLLLKLSNLLRYSVYGSKKTYVPLKEELEYIRNYIEFEQIRISDRLVLEANIPQVVSPDIKIAPLVLIVFIENAFKHAKDSLGQKVYIYISLIIADKCIHFSVVNTCCMEENKVPGFNENSGVGLKNTLKRLDLLYGDDYKLKQVPDKDLYKMELTLKIVHG
ncbi:MAG TPA: histidine kinase [Chitinophaga sp.]|uniref:sensor histidine kinase n=1 Tax=Chitinophaga sp. TaxID=1869181 RepID=UPI002DB6EE54|nr:histidine kinase [Chitinophaga sp.]HEU4551777.1 histidine kinase [Chitinophaga sp.]